MSSPLVATASGAALGLSLIVAIGAQNAFVLRTGLRGAHVAPVVVVCALSEVALISAGVLGAGAVLDRRPAAVTVAQVAGAVFLLGYATLAARRALRPSAMPVSATDGGGADETPGRLAVRTGAGTAVATALAMTWLNPHAYLDTVVLLGSIAGTWGALRWWFASGAIGAGIAWFVALGYGAAMLRPVFARPAAWRVLDGVIAVVMTLLAAGLVLGAVGAG